MHRPSLPVRVIDETLAWPRRVPVFRMFAAVRPLRRGLAAVRKARAAAVGSEIDGELTPGGEAEKLARWRGHLVASAVGLHPPLGFRELIERVDYQVGVGIVYCGIVPALLSASLAL